MPPVVERMKPSDPVEVAGIHKVSVTLLQILSGGEGRVPFHCTPTSASWLNQVEIVFSLLTRKTLRGASFQNKVQLSEAMAAFVRNPHANAQPFRWRKRDVKGSQLRNTIANLCN
jgi:hypothetical protein